MRKLSLIVANGTDALTSPIQTIHPQLDPLLTAIDTQDNAVKALFGAGLLAMRRKAGFTPAQDNLSLDKVLPCDNEQEQKPYSSDILHCLTAIYYGDYEMAYAEWLHWVALDDVTFPYEALPLMLDLATWMPKTRALTKRILGSRGRWLVEQSNHTDWYWARHIKPARRPRLTKYEKNEARVSDMLQKVRYQRLPVAVNNELRKMEFPWSAQFSKGLVMAIENMLNKQKGILANDLLDLMKPFIWHLHPKQHHHLVFNIIQYGQDRDDASLFQTLASYIKRILQFRAKLYAVFSADRA